MALTFNIEDDEFYKQGVKTEREKANLEKDQLIQKNILKAHQSGIDINMISNIFDVSIEEVKNIIKNAK